MPFPPTVHTRFEASSHTWTCVCVCVFPALDALCGHAETLLGDSAIWVLLAIYLHNSGSAPGKAPTHILLFYLRDDVVRRHGICVEPLHEVLVLFGL